MPDQGSRLGDRGGNLPSRAGDSHLELSRISSEPGKARDETGKAVPSPAFSLPKTVEGLMEKTISSFIRSDFSRSIISSAIELEISLSLAKILNRDAKRFVEQHRNDPEIVDLAAKFNLQPDVPKDPKKGRLRPFYFSL